jgi:hypothetical protein
VRRPAGELAGELVSVSLNAELRLHRRNELVDCVQQFLRGQKRPIISCIKISRLKKEDISEHESAKTRNIPAETDANEDRPPATLQKDQAAGAEGFDSST